MSASDSGFASNVATRATITPLYPVYSGEEQYPAFIRLVQVLPVFDRVLIAHALNAPYGTVSRWIVWAVSAGALTKLANTYGHYSRKDLLANGDILNKKFNYGKSSADHMRSQQYVKTAEWPSFIAGWNKFRVRSPQKVAKV
jgi:hypothetical protein